MRPGTAFYPAVTWATAEGMTQGYTTGDFRPGQANLRRNSAAFLYRMLGEPDFDWEVGDPIAFADAHSHTWHGRPIVWLGHHKIDVGDANTCFYPARPITRGEMAEWLYKLDQLIDRGVIVPAEG
jgi:hypothetical protein